MRSISVTSREPSVAVREGPVGVATVVLRGLEDGAVLFGAAQMLRSLTLPKCLIIDLSEVTLVDQVIVEVLASSVRGTADEGRRGNDVCELTGGFAMTPAAAAHVGCGDVITVDTLLDSDVGPCETGLTLDDVFGVAVTGGTVSDFDAGIFIAGGFANFVSGMEVRDNIGTGRLTSVTASSSTPPTRT
jgi:hypothetical protein